MAKKNEIQASKDAQRKKLADDVEAFINKGGSIEKIDSGVSGVSLTKPRDKGIKLGTPK